MQKKCNYIDLVLKTLLFSTISHLKEHWIVNFICVHVIRYNKLCNRNHPPNQQLSNWNIFYYLFTSGQINPKDNFCFLVLFLMCNLLLEPNEELHFPYFKFFSNITIESLHDTNHQYIFIFIKSSSLTYLSL